MTTKPTDDDENKGGAGGPVARESALIPPTMEEARVLFDLSDRGAQRSFVSSRTLAPSVLRAMVGRGFVEVRERVRGGFDVMLTPGGLKALTAATAILAATGCAR